MKVTEPIGNATSPENWTSASSAFQPPSRWTASRASEGSPSARLAVSLRAATSTLCIPILSTDTFGGLHNHVSFESAREPTEGRPGGPCPRQVLAAGSSAREGCCSIWPA